MRFGVIFFYYVLVIIKLAVVSLHAEVGIKGLANRRANSIEEKHIEKYIWSHPQKDSIPDKRFSIKNWDKYFSSLGTKRAPIQIVESKKKSDLEINILDRDEVSLDVSLWNQRIIDLHKIAGIETSDQAQLVANYKIYYMLLQNRKQFRDMGQEVSLRDLNRYQFRRNRPRGKIPVDQAGSSQ